jgi:hypothetical protein
MLSERASATQRALGAASAVAASAAILAFAAVAVARLAYPFELEWMEGGVLEHVGRILAGEKIYVEPSIEFVPFIYTPFYYYVSAVAARLLGPGFAPLRLVSLLSSLGCLAVIFHAVSREGHGRLAGLVGAGLLAASFGATGAWLDLARVDALSLLALLTASSLLLTDSSVGVHVFAAVIAALAVFTKQSALVPLAPLVVLAATHGWRPGLAFAVTAAVLVVGGGLLMDGLHDGWFLYYTLDLPAAHAFDIGEGLGRTLGLIGRRMPLALVASLALVVDETRRRGALAGLGYLMYLVALLGGSVVIGLHQGSYDNVALPGVAGLAVLGALALDRGVARAGSRAAGRSAFARAAMSVACLVQFGLLVYDPLPLVPTDRDRAAGWALVTEIEEVEGEVLVPRHGYLARRAGKRNAFAHEMAMTDVLRGDPAGRGAELRREIGRVLEARRFGAIIVDYDWLRADLERQYERRGEPVFLRRDVFWPVTGVRTRPRYYYSPRGEPPREQRR